MLSTITSSCRVNTIFPFPAIVLAYHTRGHYQPVNGMSQEQKLQHDGRTRKEAGGGRGGRFRSEGMYKYCSM